MVIEGGDVYYQRLFWTCHVLKCINKLTGRAPSRSAMHNVIGVKKNCQFRGELYAHKTNRRGLRTWKATTVGTQTGSIKLENFNRSP